MHSLGLYASYLSDPTDTEEFTQDFLRLLMQSLTDTFDIDGFRSRLLSEVLPGAVGLGASAYPLGDDATVLPSVRRVGVVEGQRVGVSTLAHGPHLTVAAALQVRGTQPHCAITFHTGKLHGLRPGGRLLTLSPLSGGGGGGWGGGGGGGGRWCPLP